MRRSKSARSLTPLSALLVLGVLGVLSLFERDARAFCRTTTQSIPADFTPIGDECWTQGNVLYWKNACVGYSLQKDSSRQVSYEDASQAITKAFTKWTSTACPTDGTGSSRTSIDVRDLGPVDCDLVQYNQDQGNQHVIIFRDETWPHNDSNNTLALTTVTFNPDTGEIYDADMEVNTHDQRVTLTDPVPPDGYDFASILTHETGHFLGMAHSGDTRATMFAHYNQGAIAMRNLTSDDIGGICTIYRPDGTRTASSGPITEDACDPTPRHGFASACGAPKKKSCVPGASVGGTSPADTRGMLLVSSVLVLAWIARRRFA